MSERELDGAGDIDMHALLHRALQVGASDLHLIAGSPRSSASMATSPGERLPVLTPGTVRRLLMSLFNHAQRERFEYRRARAGLRAHRHRRPALPRQRP